MHILERKMTSREYRDDGFELLREGSALGDVLDAESLEASQVRHVSCLISSGAQRPGLEGVLESDTTLRPA